MTDAKIEERFKCVDCSVHTGEIDECYMVQDYIWRRSGLALDGGMLCIGCLEKRINVKLTNIDFAHAPINIISQQSERLQNRINTKRVA